MRRALLLPACLALFACSLRGPTGDAANAPAADAGTLTESASPSVAEARACASPTAVKTEQGERACAATETCLAGTCVKATVEAAALVVEKGLEPPAFLRVTEEGWLGDWAVRAPLNGRQAEAIVGAQAAGAPVPDLDQMPPSETLCAPSGLVVPQKSSPRQGLNFALLSAAIVAPRAQKAELWLGVAGKARVFLRGKLVATVEGDADPAPLADETRAAIELAEGANPILVLMEQPSNAATSLRLRVRGPGHSPMDELLVAPAPAAHGACNPADLVDLAFVSEAAAGGFRTRATAQLRTLAPRAQAKIPYRVEQVEGSRITQLAHGDLDVALLSGPALGRPILELAAKPSRQGPVALRLFIDGSMREVSFVYRGELHERAARLAESVKKLDLTKARLGDRESLEALSERVLTGLANGEPDVSFLEERLADADALASALERGDDPYQGKRGVLWRAYRSRLDDALQPYLMFLPGSAKAERRRAAEGEEKRFPLILASHGLNGEPGQALRTSMGEAPERDNMNVVREARHLPPLPNLGAIVAAPSGYGNSGQRLPGEDDVMRVIDEVKGRFPVDDSKVSLTGYSLGGTVSFVVPLHHPDVFSSAAPFCGYPNFAQWSGVRDVPHTPWEDVLVRKRAIVSYAENGQYLTLHIVHGGQDGPERSAVIADRYKELGYARRFDIQQDLDHDVWEYGYEKGRMIAWLKARTRPDAPKHVLFVTEEPRYDQSYWVRVLAMRDPSLRASIDANADGADVTVKTENVDAFTLDLSAFRPKRVVVDGAALEPCAGGALNHFETRDGKAWACSATPPELEGRKRKGVSGPLEDVQLHRVLVVYGTEGRAAAEANRLVADHVRAVESSTLRWPVKADTDVTDEELASRSLVLIGGPASNKITRALADALPIKIDDRGITLRGKRYDGEGLGASFIFPSPRAKGEYVVVHAGVSPEGTLAARFLPSLAPDFLIYDARVTTQRKGLLLGKRAVVAGGFFDASWR